MRKLKSLTELAVRSQREAYIEQRCKPIPFMAPFFEKRAAELVTLPGPPVSGPGGEVVATHSAPECALANSCE